MPRIVISRGVLDLDSRKTITASACSNGRLYLGLSDGSIQVWKHTLASHNEPSEVLPDEVNPKEVTVLQESKLPKLNAEMELTVSAKVADAGVAELAVLAHPELLVVFSTNGTLSLVKTDDLSIESVSVGVSAFAVLIQQANERTTLCGDNLTLATVPVEINDVSQESIDSEGCDYTYLIVAKKKTLTTYVWKDMELASKTDKPATDKFVSIAFMSPERLLSASSNGLWLIDNVSDSATKLPVPYLFESASNSSSLRSYFRGTSINDKVRFLRVADGEFIATKNNTAIRLYEEESAPRSAKYLKIPGGLVLQKKPFSWTQPNAATYYWFPYLLTFTPQAMEVRSSRTGEVFESVGLPSTVSSVAFDADHLYVSITGKLILFNRLSFGDQLLQFEMLNRLDDALDLALKLPAESFSKPNSDTDPRQRRFLKIRNYQIEKGKLLFLNGEYSSALTLFIDYMASPDFVIGLLPDPVSEAIKIGPHTLGDPLFPVSEKQNDPKDGTVASTPNVNAKYNCLVSDLIPFLADSRRKISRLLDPRFERFEWNGIIVCENIYTTFSKNGSSDRTLRGMLELTDTTLFLCYLFVNPRMIGPLLRVSNACDPAVVKAQLTRLQLWDDLVDFYYERESHQEALNLLRDLGTSETPEFSGPSRTVKYLERLNNNNLDIILEHCKWPISVDAQYGKQIFLNDTLESESLDRGSVFKFLKSLALEDYKYNELLVSYLSHVIFIHGDQTQRFHMGLLRCYVRAMETTQSLDVFPECLMLLSTSRSYDAKEALKLLDELSQNLPTHNKKVLKLKMFPMKLLSRHSEVLDLLVFDVRDYDSALTYCAELYGENKELGVTWLEELLHRYLNPPKGHEINMDKALALLSSHGSVLSLSKVLSSLPKNTPIADINFFLIAQLRHTEMHVEKSRMQSALLKVDVIKQQHKKRTLESQNFSVVHQKIRQDWNFDNGPVKDVCLCRVCRKKLGKESVLFVSPGITQVIHYGCRPIQK